VPVIGKVVERLAKDLSGIRRESDVKRQHGSADPLIDALDYLLGETLVAWRTQRRTAKRDAE
jgi:hypothetical protein